MALTFFLSQVLPLQAAEPITVNPSGSMTPVTPLGNSSNDTTSLEPPSTEENPPANSGETFLQAGPLSQATADSPVPLPGAPFLEKGGEDKGRSTKFTQSDDESVKWSYNLGSSRAAKSHLAIHWNNPRVEDLSGVTSFGFEFTVETPKGCSAAECFKVRFEDALGNRAEFSVWAADSNPFDWSRSQSEILALRPQFDFTQVTEISFLKLNPRWANPSYKGPTGGSIVIRLQGLDPVEKESVPPQQAAVPLTALPGFGIVASTGWPTSVYPNRGNEYRVKYDFRRGPRSKSAERGMKIEFDRLNGADLSSLGTIALTLRAPKPAGKVRMQLADVEGNIDFVDLDQVETAEKFWGVDLNFFQRVDLTRIKEISLTVLWGVARSVGEFYARILVDTTAPEGSILINNQAFSTANRTVQLTLASSDLQNPNPIQMAFSTDGVNFSPPTNLRPDPSLELPDGPDGARTVFVKFIDRIGNESVFSDTIILDRQAPVGTVSINNSATHTNSADITLTLDADDIFSQDANLQMAFSQDGINFTAFEAFNAQKNLTLTGNDGNRTITVRFRDEAGNTVNITDSIILDRIPPVVPRGDLKFEQSFNSITQDLRDGFSRVLALIGDRILVGTAFDDTSATNVGALYLFDRTGNLVTTFLNPTPADEDRFGWAVAVSETLLVVGEPRDHIGTNQVGSVHLFDADPNSPTFGTLLKTLRSPAPSLGDEFGFSVAVLDGLIIVGEPEHSPDLGAGRSAGRIHVFDGNPESPSFGNLLTTIENPNPVRGDRFGISVGTAGPNIVVAKASKDPSQLPPDAEVLFLFDGNLQSPTFGQLLKSYQSPNPKYVGDTNKPIVPLGKHFLAGAPVDNSVGGSFAGAVYLFDADSASSTFGQLLQTLRKPTPAAFDKFGQSIVVSDDSLFIGAPGDDTLDFGSGAVLRFNGDPASPTFGEFIETILTPNPIIDGIPKNFGFFLAAGGDDLLIGEPFDVFGNQSLARAGQAHLFSFERIGISVNDGAQATNSNNVVLSLSAIDNLTAQPNLQMAFSQDGGQTFTPFEPFNAQKNLTLEGNDGLKTVIVRYRDEAGNETDLSRSIILDQTPPQGSIGGIELERGILNPAPINGDIARFGNSVALSLDRILVGAPDDDEADREAGAAYLYDRNGDLLRTFVNPKIGARSFSKFGNSVTFAGELIAIGSRYDDLADIYNAGSVFLFDQDGNLLRTLLGPTPYHEEEFGFSLAYENGVLAVGSIGDRVGSVWAGTVSLFDVDPASPAFGSLLKYISNPTPAAFDDFGSSMAFIGKLLAVGALYDEPLGYFDTGVVHLFDADPQSATFGALLRTIENPLLGTFDNFGRSIASVGKNLLVGVPLHNPASLTDSGVAYLFDADSMSPTFGSLLKIFNNPTPASFDQFGSSMAAAGTRVIIGAQKDDMASTDAGAFYVFDGDPTSADFGQLLDTVLNPDASGGANFGAAAGGYDEGFIIGAPLHREAGSQIGKVYLHRLGIAAISINDGEEITNSSNVTLTLEARDNLTAQPNLQMAFSQDAGQTFTSFEPFSTQKNFTLEGNDGTKTLTVRYKDKAGNTADFSDTIILDRS